MGNSLVCENKLIINDEINLLDNLITKLKFSEFKETIIVVEKKHDKYMFYNYISENFIFSEFYECTFEEKYILCNLDEQWNDDNNYRELEFIDEEYHEENSNIYFVSKRKVENLILKINNVTHKMINKKFYLEKIFEYTGKNIFVYPNSKLGKIKLD